MLNYFLQTFLLHPTAEGGGSGTSGTDNTEDKDKDEKGKEETITLTKAELEQKLEQKFAEGARKANKTSGTDNSQNATTTKNTGADNQVNVEDFNSVKDELELLRGEKLALKQGVKADYTEDAVAILKGKGLEINEANMKAIVDKHPEWKASNSTTDGNELTAKALGSTGGKTTTAQPSEQDQASKLFGL